MFNLYVIGIIMKIRPFLVTQAGIYNRAFVVLPREYIVASGMSDLATPVSEYPRGNDQDTFGWMTGLDRRRDSLFQTNIYIYIFSDEGKRFNLQGWDGITWDFIKTLCSIVVYFVVRHAFLLSTHGTT